MRSRDHGPGGAAATVETGWASAAPAPATFPSEALAVPTSSSWKTARFRVKSLGVISE